MSSNKLLKNGTVISFDESTQTIKVLRNTSVLIEHDRITKIFGDSDNAPLPTDTEVIDATDKIVSPGFTNTHSHMWETAWRSMAPNLTLMQYMLWTSPVGTAAASFAADDIYISSLQGYLEALNAGVTTIVEHAHQDWNEEIFEPGYNGAVDAGARTWYCYSVGGSAKFSADDQYAAMVKLRERKDDPRELISLGLALDAIHQMDEGRIEETKRAIKKLDLQAVTLHHLGGPWFGGSQTSSPANLAAKGFQDLNIPIVFSHASFLTPADNQALRKHNWNVSITPESELHYGHGHGATKQVLDQASIGIDTNWTFSGDIINQGRLLLQHIRGEEYGDILATGKIPQKCPFNVEEAFLLMTRQGGQAVRRDDIGVLKEGAKADIVVIDGDSPNMLGWTNPVAAVVLHTNVGDIEHVLVDGEFRKRDHKLILKTGELSDIKRRFVEAARRIQKENEEGLPNLPSEMLGMQLKCGQSYSTRKGSH